MHRIPFKILLPVVICMLCLPAKLSAQGIYSLNVDNGLPTNYTYSVITDQYGYLWIATQKGVARYNGYETVLFNNASGLQEEDVWRLYEDKKRRIWLSSISRQVGYVHNNKYKAVFNLANKSLYPHEIRDNDSGIFFVSSYQDENSHTQVLYIERNDTLYYKTLDNTIHYFVPRNTNTVIITRNDSVYKLYPDFDIHNTNYVKKRTFLRTYAGVANELKAWLLGNYLLFTKKNDHFISAMPLNNNGTYKVINFHKPGSVPEKVEIVFYSDDNYYGTKDPVVVTDKAVYSIDTLLNIKKIADISTITGIPGPITASYYIRNDLWGQCLSTFGKGVYLNLRLYSKLKKLPATPLADFKYVGHIPDESGYWWNANTHTLAQVQRNNIINYKRYEGINLIEDITRYNDDFSLLISRNTLFLLDNRTLKLTNFMEHFRWIYNGDLKVNATSTWDAYRVLYYKRNGFYLLSKALGLLTFTFGKDSLSITNINRDRFRDIAYDNNTRSLWLYNADDIEIYKDGGKARSLARDSLAALGIKNIEKIAFDTLGNVFLKEYDRLLVFNKDMHGARALFQNYMLGGASINIYGNILIVAGKFGVLFSKISGPQKISKEIVYHNIKNTQYNYVSDVQVMNDKVLLNTDKGMYEAGIPAAKEFDDYTADNRIKFRMVLFYNDSLYAINRGTVINIDQENLKLEFDVINPAGNGKVIYQYKIPGLDSEWNQSNTRDILLSQLQPGKTYTLSVRIHDNIIKSEPVNMQLYIVPYWWQKPVWVKTFWVCGFILLLAFGYSIAFITRKRVIKNNAKKNQLLELELKAVYSQINPHFIYNTLNSALLLIHNGKIEEAYTHVSKFSRLLRAYVRSSRNKYITVGEEVANLKNYIELQQARFRNKFLYKIEIDEDSPVKNVKIPSLLLQPFVENAINHGLTPKEGTGNLVIRFIESSENELTCIIEDDGIGRKRSGQFKENKLTESYGDQLVKDLVRVFNTYERMRIEIQYIDKADPMTGTIVEIRIKNL